MASIWSKQDIIIDNLPSRATLPLILSASRRTDIPAWGTDLFMNQWNRGYFQVKNPFNPLSQETVSTQNVRVIIFWTKDPSPLLPHLPFFDKEGIGYYFLYTLNDYESEGYEKALPPLSKRLDVFKKLSSSIGPEKVLWRFDPIILDGKNEGRILEKAESIAKQLSGFTIKCIFSFLDIDMYSSVKRNLEQHKIFIPSTNRETVKKTIQELKKICDSNNIIPASCSSKTNFTEFGISPNSCIDSDLIKKLFPHDEKLMSFIDIHEGKLKDKNQRKECGCMWSKDIGAYNTCSFDCVYCYAKKK